jgi:hypothetical protein
LEHWEIWSMGVRGKERAHTPRSLGPLICPGVHVFAELSRRASVLPCSSEIVHCQRTVTSAQQPSSASSWVLV